MWLGSGAMAQARGLFGVLYGLRISLSVGVLSGVLALLVGMVVGLFAAFVGGRADTLIMRLVDLQLSFPASLVALMLIALLGKGIDKIIIALVVVQWAYYARTVRASAMVERRKEYVEAHGSLGLSRWRVMFSTCAAPAACGATDRRGHGTGWHARLAQATVFPGRGPAADPNPLWVC
ncbi:MAG: ABC transporter permease [Burkholderiaceae bacterium]